MTDVVFAELPPFRFGKARIAIGHLSIHSNVIIFQLALPRLVVHRTLRTSRSRHFRGLPLVTLPVLCTREQLATDTTPWFRLSPDIIKDYDLVMWTGHPTGGQIHWVLSSRSSASTTQEPRTCTTSTTQLTTHRFYCLYVINTRHPVTLSTNWATDEGPQTLLGTYFQPWFFGW